MSSLHTAIPTPSFCSFWHSHPYIPIHFLKMFYILYIHIYSEGSYETVHALQNVHLLPLIEINLTVNWQDGWTALMYAAQNGHSNVVEMLLQHGASVDMQSVVSTL